MFDDTESDERECIQIEPNARHSSPNAASSTAARFRDASPKRRLGSGSGEAPGSRLTIAVWLIAPWASTFGIRSAALPKCPVAAQPLARSVLVVIQRRTKTSTSLPCGS